MMPNAVNTVLLIDTLSKLRKLEGKNKRLASEIGVWRLEVDTLKADHAALVRALKESRAETEAMRLHKEAQREANLNGAKRLAEVVGERDALVRLVEEWADSWGDSHDYVDCQKKRDF